MSNRTIYKSQEGKNNILQAYETYISSMGAEFERIFVETRYGRTHTLATGPKDAKPIFIFQGGNCINPMTLSWFSALFPDYRIYAPDTVGHPGYSAETRISAKDDSFALWISDLMEHFEVEKSAFIGPSYGGGIILRLAAFMPEKIACTVLVVPAGIKLGSKGKMIRNILLPMILYKLNSSQIQLQNIADAMSAGCMRETDKRIIGDIFKYVKLEQDMPKLTEKRELMNYSSPTLVLTGREDIFFPAGKLMKASEQLFANAVIRDYPIAHFPDPESLKVMNQDIRQFLAEHY